jgi:outer membrane protein assembly factor BamB
MAPKKRALSRVSLLAAVTLLTLTATAQDWPQWRGPNRDGGATGFAEPATWPDTLKQQWKVEIGLGYATPLLVGNRLYTFTRQGTEEVLQALDAPTGKQVWRTAYAAPFEVYAATAKHGAGPKSTPTFANGRIFTFGMSSIVTAFDAATGKQLWQKPKSEKQPMFHTAMSPIVDGDRVIIHVGGPGDTALAAYDVATGAERWKWQGDSPAYGSPIVATFAGTRQIVLFTHQNLVGISAADGRLLWQRPFTTPSNTTSQTPIIYKDMIIQAGRENGFTAFRVVRDNAAWSTENVWRTDEASVHMSNSVVIDSLLYGLSHLNSGQYFALDLDSGQVLWKSQPRQAENAAIVKAGTTLFMLQNDAKLAILKANRTGFNPLKTYEVAMSETWTQPVVSGNRIFVKDVSNLTLWTLN